MKKTICISNDYYDYSKEEERTTWSDLKRRILMIMYNLQIKKTDKI